ncbi:TetR/AcrR family transcriptional regulator [Cohnella sp. AR92]|uniref:TetR/AcrR family transcriptional regulator n=1 Tax=Cohnella sp. AR92 TaxID=648716 RepID=UPI000F8F14E8|nr:TetR/AcrR family transcriptional regulator [Cohnella sp. AR92]RUS42821.1 TetR/AcrR family transcriptional regulator [Cohnella sp. AR92]
MDVESPYRDRSAQRKLKESLLSVISTGGYDHTTITDITKQAQLSRTAFYNNYHNKEELLQDLVEDIQEGYVQSIRDSFGKNRTVDFAVFPSMKPVFRFVAEHSPFFDYLWSGNASTKMLLGFYDFFVQMYKTELNFTPITPSGDINMEDTAEYLALAAISLIGYWVRSGYEYSVEEIDEQLQRLHKEKRAGWYFLDPEWTKSVWSERAECLPEDRRIVRTRDSIHAAYLSLVKDDVPEEAITVKSIADRANIRRATFYAHYKDKQQLIERMVDDFGDQILPQLSVSPHQGERGCMEACDRLFAAIDANQAFLRALRHPGIRQLFFVRLSRLLMDFYRQSQVAISFDRELYVQYVSGVMLELISSRAGALIDVTPFRLTADKVIHLINQKEYRLTVI